MNNNAVYVLRDKCGITRRAGVTNNIKKRRGEHHWKNPGFLFVVVANGLSREQALDEEAKIKQLFHTSKRNNGLNYHEKVETKENYQDLARINSRMTHYQKVLEKAQETGNEIAKRHALNALKQVRLELSQW